MALPLPTFLTYRSGVASVQGQMRKHPFVYRLVGLVLLIGAGMTYHTDGKKTEAGTRPAGLYVRDYRASLPKWDDKN